MLEALLQFRHRRFRRDLSAYVDNMLSERARRRLEAHLDSCQACREELADLRVTVEALGSLPMADVPRSFTLAAAPVAEVSPRPAARRLEFGLRLATATAAFALALVLIGDFAGLPGGGEEEMPTALAPAPEERRETYGITETGPQIEETPAVAEAPPEETPEPPVYGITEAQPPAPAVGADVSEEEPSGKETIEGVEVEEEAEAGAADGQALGEEEGGGLSREEAVRWLEIGLGAGVGFLVVLWALALLQRNMGKRL